MTQNPAPRLLAHLFGLALALCGPLLLAPAQAKAQAAADTINRTYHNQSALWGSASFDLRFSDRWGLHLDGQVRRANLVAEDMQYVGRIGLTFHFPDHAQLTAGYVFNQRYPYGDRPSIAARPEHRIYQEFSTSQELGRTRLLHRFRQEQRFIGIMVTDTAMPVDSAGNPQFVTDRFDFRNRSRYQVRFEFPLYGDLQVPKTLYAALQEEIFLQYGSNVRLNFLQQNRLAALIGYQIRRDLTLELGYLNQLRVEPDNVNFEVNHTVSISLHYAPDFRTL